LPSLQFFCRLRKVLPATTVRVKMLTYFKALRPKSGYNVDEAYNAKPHTAELFATVRDNGRILDDFRCVLGGHAVFEASFELGKVMEDPSISRWTVHLQKWPRDVNLRAGMLTGVWSDVAGLVSSRDAAVFDAQGAQIPPNEFLRRLTEDDSDPLFASVRWAVVLGDNGRLVAQIQGLPGPAAVLNGKPALKRSVKKPFFFV
jgi:hypothetical protein